MAYRVVVDPDDQQGLELRGDNRKFMACKAAEVVLSGPADTGKSVAACAKLHLTCLRYPKSQHGMVRKTYAAIAGSVLQTFVRVAAGSGAQVVGGDQPKKVLYPNGATIWIGGMDKPERVLSSERDTIYVNQAEELTMKDWEILSTRCSGRGAVVKHPQLNGDCNPGGSKHWIKERAKVGSLVLLAARHADNPTLYHNDGSVVADGDVVAGRVVDRGGAQRLAVLDKLTGVRRLRLRDGVWATAEGAVYDMFNALVHAVPRPDSEFVRWYLAMDEGYTNPQVTLLVGEDSDGRWHVAREFYVTGKLESDIVAHAYGWWIEKRVTLCACDNAAAGLIAALNNKGVGTKGGKGEVVAGIHKLQDRLKVAGDGRPRLTVDPSCVETINEFESHIWKAGKDEPVDEYNHSLGSLRYLQDVLSSTSASQATPPSPERYRGRRGEGMW